MSMSNPMPPLLPAVREALAESIREHGVICPIVKDQTGFILEGYNRSAIADSLGVPCPEVVHECEPDQREILRIELNGARRQITAADWKPLVDHLRAQITDEGVRRFSDRSIARAVGVAHRTVGDYQPDSAVVRNRTTALKVTMEDGKVRNRNPEWTAEARALHLITHSTTGLTADDLHKDDVLGEFGHSTVSRLPGILRDRGQVEAIGKRGRSNVWVATPAGTAPPPRERPAAAAPPPPPTPPKPTSWNGKSRTARAKEIRAEMKGSYSRLLRLQMDMTKMITIIADWTPEDFELDQATLALVDSFYDDLITLGEWHDRAVLATQAWLASVDVRKKIAALRDTTGRTPEERETALRLADRLERKLGAQLSA